MAGFVLAAGLSTCPGFFFRRHYFILLLPAIALLIGIGISGAAHILRQKRHPASRVSLTYWSFAVAIALTVLAHRSVWFELSPTLAARAVYGRNPFPEAELVARFIRANSEPTAKVAVLGSEPEIYFLSQRRSATGYIYTYALTEPQPYAARMQDEMISEVESTNPEYVVLAMDRFLLLRPGASTKLFDWWTEGYQTNYSLVGASFMAQSGEATFLSAPEASGVATFGPGSLLVFRKR